MAIIKPFRALRPNPERAESVSCAPYDVVYESEVRRIIEENPKSFLRVTRPEAEFPEGETPPIEQVFARAKENLEKFIADEIFASESEPSFYVYRLESSAHRQTGVVACCSLDEYELGAIKRHEKTRPDKVADRTAHILTVKAQTGLIFLAFRNTETIRRLIDEAAQTKPIYDFYCASNVKQTVWRVARTEDLAAAFAEVPAIYIADGHHRMESANLARRRLAQENPEHTGAENYNFVVAGIFPSEDLHILAYNRAVKDLNGLSEAEFYALASANFIVTETDAKVPAKRGEFGVYLGGKWMNLKFAPKSGEKLNVIENLDVSILQNYILQPILNIDDPRTNERISFVGGARGTEELERMVDEGAAKIAFSMFPTTMEDLFAVSDTGEIMPPKSTWFEPKLRDGLLIHLI